MLEFLAYQAPLVGSMVVKIDAHYTAELVLVASIALEHLTQKIPIFCVRPTGVKYVLERVGAGRPHTGAVLPKTVELAGRFSQAT